MKAPWDRIEAALGTKIVATRSLHGGSINQAVRVDVDGGTFFAKYNETSSAMFSTEAAGLSSLKASGTSLTIPDVVAFEDPVPGAPGFIVLEFLEPGGRPGDFDERLGQGLATLHRATRDTFGFDIDTYCGLSVQPNQAGSRWVDFYREQRLRHQLHLGRRCYSSGDVRAIESLLQRLDTYLEDDESPALIHGDLWSGNLIAAATGPALIDPATSYAHREAELGMMTLFGGFSARVFAAYHEAWPLRPGWRERNPLYELYHLMNHATLFGGSYAAQVMGVVRRFT